MKYKIQIKIIMSHYIYKNNKVENNYKFNMIVYKINCKKW